MTVTLSVHDHCQRQGITLEQLAEQSGLEPSRTKAIYLGRWTPSPAERSTIAGALGVEIDEIAWGHKTPVQHIYGQGPA